MSSPLTKKKSKHYVGHMVPLYIWFSSSHGKRGLARSCEHAMMKLQNRTHVRCTRGAEDTMLWPVGGKDIAEHS
jgi:hypothetical protein